MATIDNLTLEVNADITKAKKALNDLSSSLTNLKTKMGTVGTAYKNLAKSLAGVTVSKDTTKAVTSLAKCLSTFNDVKSTNLNKLENTGAILTSLSKSISKVSIPTKNINAVVRMANALSTLNAVKPGNIEKTAENLRLLLDSIKKVSLSKQSSNQIAQIAKMGDSLGKLNQINPNKIDKTATYLTSLQASVSGVTYETIDKIDKLATALSKLSNLDAEVLKGFAKVTRSASKVGASPLTSGVTQKNKKIKNVVTTDNIDDQNLSNWEKNMFKINAAIDKAIPSFKSFSKVVSTLGGVFKKAINPILKFVKSIGRIAFYRAIRAVLKEISQGLTEGVQNLAKYSKAIGELDSLKANQVMSGYASYFLYFKNAIATAVMPVLKALLPLVQAVIDKLVAFIDILAQIGAAFFGITYTSAKLFWIDYADALDNANNSAGKLHKQLAGFDELNNLTTNSGGGGKWNDLSNYFEELEITKKIREFVEKIKEAWKNVKDAVAEIFEPLKKVNDKLKEIWDKTYRKIYPHLKRIKKALKTIWTEGLKPLLEGLVEGFFEGYYGEEFENFPDLMGFLADKLADCAEKVAEFVSNIDNDKIKEFGENLGKTAGVLMFLTNPLGIILSIVDPLNSRIGDLGEHIGELAGTKIQELKDKLDELKEKWDYNNDGVVTLDDVVKTLTTDMFELGKTISYDVYDKLLELSTQLQDTRDKLDYNGDGVITLRDAYDKLRISLFELGEKLAPNIATLVTNLTELKDLLEGLLLYDLGKLYDELDLDNSGVTTLDEAVRGLTAKLLIFATTNEVTTYVLGLLNDILKKVNEKIAKCAEKVEDVTYKIGLWFLAINKNGQFDTLIDGLDKVWSIADKVKKLFEDLTNINLVEWAKRFAEVFNINILNSNRSSGGGIATRANGGFVSRGDLFVANERGAEMVGSVNGNTAVANNQMITEAIAQATYQAMSQALSENGMNITIEGDSDGMFKVLQKKNREYKNMTGRSAFA